MNPGFLWGGPQAWVSVETLQLLWMESQRGEFWPGVRSLKSNISWEVAPFISLFLTPMITNLDLTLPRESNRLLQPTLSLLANTCHQLQSLVMSANSSSPLAGIEMGLLISASRDTLRRVEIRSFTPPDVFPVIFSLPRLQDLTLQELKFPNQIPPEVLPRLQAISLNGSDGPNLTQFLGAVSAPGLTALAIFHRGTVQLSPLLESLRGASTTMNTLYILPSAPFDHSSITILRSFTSLTSLTIGCGCEDLRPSGPCSFQLTDEDVQELGEALPRVRHLRLAPGCREPRQVTFRSLVWLSRTCSALGNLAIRVDFTNIADNSDQPDRDAPIQGANNGRPLRAESPLTALTVGNSPLPDIPSCEWMVALALVTVFPSIRFISSYRTENMHVRWEEVQEDILVCKKIFRVAGECHGPSVWRLRFRRVRFRHQPISANH